MAAEWWTNPNSRGDNPVVAHTPDETQYHYPDNRQMDLMRGGAAMGVVVPRANDDGTSKGFDGRVAGVVHVDPDAPDGGAIVDLSHLNRNEYAQAFAQSTYPHEVFYRLGASPPELGIKQPERPTRAVTRENPLVPTGSYIVPPANEDGSQLQFQPVQEGPMKPIPPIPPMPGIVPQPSAVVPPPQAAQQFQQPAPVMPQPVYQQQPYFALPPAVPPLDPNQLYAVLGNLAQRVDQLTGHVQSMQGMMPPVPPLAPSALQTLPQAAAQVRRPRPLDEINSLPERHRGKVRIFQDAATAIPRRVAEEVDGEDEVQTVGQVNEAARREVSDGVVMGFETLGMRFLKGPIAEKPKREVLFTMPGMGAMSVRYHDVRDGGDCVALVYDTRYEDGQQFLPPDLGEQRIKISVPKLKGGKRIVENHVCSTMGIHFNVGVLDIVVLIKHNDEGPDEEELEVDEDES